MIIKTNEKKYVKANQYLETNKDNIWAIGDANGKQMFRHTANKEAEIAWHNATSEEKINMDYSRIPHAVFSNPQIASVGLKEKDAQKTHNIQIGKAKYSDVAKGQAMMEENGLAKAIIEQKTYNILGFHIIGPYAPILIQEVVNAMANKEDVFSINRGLHIHPALPELILEAFNNIN